MYVGYDLGKIYSKINKKKNMNENVYFVRLSNIWTIVYLIPDNSSGAKRAQLLKKRLREKVLQNFMTSP